MPSLASGSFLAMEGFTLSTLKNQQINCNDKFDVLAGSFLQEKGLLFPQVFDADFIRQIFQDENALFGQDDIFSTPLNNGISKESKALMLGMVRAGEVYAPGNVAIGIAFDSQISQVCIVRAYGNNGLSAFGFDFQGYIAIESDDENVGFISNNFRSRM